MSTIPASQIATVLPSVLPAGGSAIALNGLVLTTNTRVPIGTVMSFPGLASVQDFFGASDAMALGAAVYFAGYDGSTKKPGALLVAQYPSDEVAAYLRGGDISAVPLATLQGYAGSLDIVIDGVARNASSVDLSTATSFSSAAGIIETALIAAAPAAASVTGSIGGGVTASAGAAFTGSGSGTNLTASAVTGVIHVGAAVAGTGVPSGTYIVSQTSGSAGGAGVYVTNHATTSSSDALTASSNTLDVTAVASGTIQPTDAISGTGVASGTTVLAQISGAPGGVGLYTISSQQHVASASVTSLSTILVVTAVGSGTVEVGAVLSGTGVTSGTAVTANMSGTGGTGTYRLSDASTTISETITASAADPEVTYDSVSGAFVVASGITGADSTIAFATGTIAASLLMTAATGASLSQGAAAAVPADFMAALIAVTTNWALFTTAADPDETGFANKLLFSAWANSSQNRYGYVPCDTQVSPTLSAPDTTCFAYAVDQADYSGTIPVWELAAGDLLKNWFVLGWAASLDVERTNGRATLAFRAQTGLEADVTDGTVSVNLGGNPQTVGDRGNGYNFYGVYGSGNQDDTFLNRGFVSGPFLFADSYVNQIWGNNLLQAALMSYFRQAGSTPFNTAGYGAIEEALAGAIAAMGKFGVYVPGVTLSASQIADLNAQAGKDIATTLQQRGWVLQINAASPTTRTSRGPVTGTFWYTDGQSIQSITLGSVAVL